ncbi:hypothetical protein [Psychrobacillus sp. L4]|uniref:anti-sigma-I factor RsgI family protein n=1 Tax=Psychrobacillus sp. L4 TaxID=3236892 RepID=UPI0036F3B6E6
MMRVYKGLVCEKKNKYSVFITKEGEFLRGIPLGTNPEIGEEAHFHLFEATTQRRKWLKPSILGPVLVAAMLLIFIVVSFIPNPDIALAYVQVDGKNAVELGVNKNGQVVTIRSLNDTPIDLVDWEGHPIDLVLAKAVKQISPLNEEIAITTVYENKKQSSEMRKKIEMALEEVRNSHSENVWTINESTAEEREKANKQNTSIQKLKHKEHQINTERKKPDTYIKDSNKNNPKDANRDKYINKDKYTPSKENNEHRKEANEKIKEQQSKEQAKIKEELEKQKARQTKELENQQENLNKAKEKATKEKEKEREKERDKAEKEQKNEQKNEQKKEEKEKEKKEKEKEKEKEEKHHRQDDQGEDD